MISFTALPAYRDGAASPARARNPHRPSEIAARAWDDGRASRKLEDKPSREALEKVCVERGWIVASSPGAWQALER
jgi:hypothetical protein